MKIALISSWIVRVFKIDFLNTWINGQNVLYRGPSLLARAKRTGLSVLLTLLQVVVLPNQQTCYQLSHYLHYLNDGCHGILDDFYRLVGNPS